MRLKQTIKTIIPAPLWTQLRLLRLHYARASYRPRRVRHLYGGFELEVELVDGMGAGWYDHDWPDLPEIAFLRQHRLRPGARVFDIGAHQCVVALILAKTVGPEGFVLAVEANRDNHAAGEKNRRLNNADNCRILHAAGAAKSGILTFNLGPNGQVDDGSGEWGRTEVTAVSVDDLAAVHGVPDVLFIDVEGFECALAQGAQKTLVSRPDCFVEVHVGVGLERLGGSVDQLLNLFPEGYDFFVAPPEGVFVKLERSSEVLHQRFFLVAVHPQPSTRSSK